MFARRAGFVSGWDKGMATGKSVAGNEHWWRNRCWNTVWLKVKYQQPLTLYLTISKFKVHTEIWLLVTSNMLTLFKSKYLNRKCKISINMMSIQCCWNRMFNFIKSQLPKEELHNWFWPSNDKLFISPNSLQQLFHKAIFIKSLIFSS